MQPQMQQLVQNQTLAFQQQQQWERMRRRQPSTPRPIVNMHMDKERPLVQVKLENPSDFPLDGNNAFTTMNSRHPQLQYQQQQVAAMSTLRAPTGNQFRQLASLQVPQIQAQVHSP